MKFLLYIHLCTLFLLGVKCGLVTDFINTVKENVNDVKEFNVNVIKSVKSEAHKVIDGVSGIFKAKKDDETGHKDSTNETSVYEMDPEKDKNPDIESTNALNGKKEPIKNKASTTTETVTLNNKQESTTVKLTVKTTTQSTATTTKNIEESQKPDKPQTMKNATVVKQQVNDTKSNLLETTIVFPDEMKKMVNHSKIVIADPSQIVYTDDIIQRNIRSLSNKMRKNSFRADKCLNGQVRSSIDGMCKDVTKY